MKMGTASMRNLLSRVFGTWSICLLFLLFAGETYAQNNFPLDRDAVLPYDQLLNNKNIDYHTGVKPFLSNELAEVKDTAIHYKHYQARQFSDSVLDQKKLRVNAVPFPMSLTGGYDLKNHTAVNDIYASLAMRFYYTKKFALELIYLAGSSNLPGYVDSTAKNSHILPGIGSAYYTRSGFGAKGYSYQDFFGFLSYSPNKVFNFQLGKDKHFFGDGYRSMFLSDNAADYPFFKIQAHVWKIKWVNLFTQMTDATNPSGLQQTFKTKYSSMQYLSWNATKRINISFFEAIVWQGNDTNRVRGFDINYMNPVAFYRPTEYSLGSPDNAFVGTSFKVKLPLQLQLYGQVMLDEFVLHELLARKGWWGNKYGLQAGLKAFDLFGIKNLSMLTELNYVRPYTYSHGSVQQNYAHFNQPLADPLGANFEEFIGILDYRVNRFIIELKGVAALTGRDTSGKDFGQNIFLPYTSRVQDYGNYLGQGRKTAIGTAEFRVGYLLYPRLNLKLELGTQYHTIRASGLAPQDYEVFTIGIKSSFYNTYRDY
jgi:hypothetical protein